MLNDYVTQPLLTVSKVNKVKESMIFSSSDDIRLKRFRETSMWLYNDWHARIAKLLANQREESSSVISSDCNRDDACDDAIREENSDAISSDCNGYDAHHDTINYFIDSKEESIEKITMKMKQLK